MKKKIWIHLLLIISVLLIAWRLSPHSLYAMLSVSQEDISSFNATVLESWPQDGKPAHAAYKMEQVPQDEEPFSAFLSILEGSDYRADFRNLLPWAVSSVESSSHSSNTSASVSLYLDGVEDGRHISLDLLDSTTLAVRLPGRDGFLVFHPTDRGLILDLANFVKAHGTEQ